MAGIFGRGASSTPAVEDLVSSEGKVDIRLPFFAGAPGVPEA